MLNTANAMNDSVVKLATSKRWGLIPQHFNSRERPPKGGADDMKTYPNTPQSA